MIGQVAEIIEAIKFLNEDGSLPKNTRIKLQSIAQTLVDHTDISLCVSKALSDLDELQEDNNIQPFIRTQLFHVASMLERVEC